MSKRLLYLEKITSEGSVDPFHWYCLAQEYRSLERYPEAVKSFTKLSEIAPDYVPMFLMWGQMYEKMGHPEYAVAIFDKGIAAAKKKGDSHALGELESARALLG